MECPSNILETLLCDYWNFPKDQHLLLSNHTLLTQKQLFHRELLKKAFPLKCSLDVRNIATLREHSPNISGTLRAGWIETKGVVSGTSREKLCHNTGLAIFNNQTLTYLFEIVCLKSFL